MSNSKKPRKASEKNESGAIERKAVNDIIQKIVDVHATIDQSLAEISQTCQSGRECEGK